MFGLEEAVLELATIVGTGDGLTLSAMGTLWSGFAALLAFAGFVLYWILRPLKKALATVNYNTVMLGMAVNDYANRDREFRVLWWNACRRRHPEDTPPEQTEIPRFDMPKFLAINGELGGND